MKNLLGSVWRSLILATYLKHDPFLAYSMASFNSGGGWQEVLLKSALLVTQNHVSYATLRPHEGNHLNSAGRRCFFSNDALDRGVSRRGTRFRDLFSPGSFRILRSVLAAALQFSSAPRSFLR